MKSFGQLSEDLETRRQELKQRQREQGARFKEKGADTLKQKDIDKADAIADEYVPSETVKKLVESGKFTKEEILKIVEVESLGK